MNLTDLLYLVFTLVAIHTVYNSIKELIRNNGKWDSSDAPYTRQSLIALTFALVFILISILHFYDLVFQN